MNRIPDEDRFRELLEDLFIQHGLIPPEPANRIPEPEELPFTDADTTALTEMVDRTMVHIPAAPVFDDHLLEGNEVTGDVKITRSANAAYRAKRTWIQGLLASVLVSVGGALAALQQSAEIDWKLIGVSVGQAILTGVVSYLHNDKTADPAAGE